MINKVNVNFLGVKTMSIAAIASVIAFGIFIVATWLYGKSAD